MLKVQKDKDIKTITKGVYEQLYKPLGYKIVKDKKINNEGIQNKTIEKQNEKPKTLTSKVSKKVEVESDDLE